MKRENDEITDLFRSRLDDLEMPVRDGFWEELNQEVATVSHHRRLILLRVTAAASVLLVLAASSAAFWYFSPKEEIEKAFTEIAVANSGSLDGDVVKQVSDPTVVHPIAQKPVACNVSYPSSYSSEEDSSISGTVSMSFSFSMSSTTTRGGEQTNANCNDGLRHAGSNTEQTTAAAEQEAPATVLTKAHQPNRWALKAAMGTSLPADNGRYKTPITAALTVERQLNRHLAIETGLCYSNLRSEGQNLHYVGIPVKMNIELAQTRKVGFYATVGGMVEKCIAGAPNHSFKKEPLQLALHAGLGVNVQLNDRMGLFAEPGVSHYFGTDSGLKSVRTERPTNLNLICGIRMTY